MPSTSCTRQALYIGVDGVPDLSAPLYTCTSTIILLIGVRSSGSTSVLISYASYRCYNILAGSSFVLVAGALVEDS